MSRLGWKPAPVSLASLASGEHPAAKEHAVPASVSLMEVCWMDWMDQPCFSGCPATLRGIDLTAVVGSYFPCFLGVACSTPLCSFGWKPVSTLGWKPAEFMESLHSGKHSAPPEDMFSPLSFPFRWMPVGELDEPKPKVASTVKPQQCHQLDM